MLEQEIAALKIENARLNQIITVLLEQNQYLKRGIAVAEKGSGQTELSISSAESSNGNSELGNSIAENSNGKPEVTNSIAEIGKGNTVVEISVAETSKGKTDVWKPVSETGNGKTESLAPLPVFVPLSDGNITRVYSFLKNNGFNKVRFDAIVNAAKLLIHFHNKGGGGYPELLKLTGLSRDGLGKYLMSLKKRGLIMRDGWQKFKPTATGTSVLQRAGVKAE